VYVRVNAWFECLEWIFPSAVASSFSEGIAEGFRFPFSFVEVPAAVMRGSSFYKYGLVVFGRAFCYGWGWMTVE